ncbi:transposase IS116/IS110/IS902 family protein [Photobacterium lutimaris]|nr:transposase IS116/IS110/IS902 family protein [Photobacterium lutimaris]
MASKYVAPFRTGAKNDLNDAVAICVAVTRPQRASLRQIARAIISDSDEHLLSINQRIADQEHCFNMLVSRSHNAQKIMKVAGIGPITATAVIASIGKGEQFDRGRDFAAWLGLVPSQYSTGGKPRLGRITKKGDKHLRTLLVHCARAVISAIGNKTDRLSLWCK